MDIDWVTVAAQIVNFLVLAWLLHRFLYGPITRAMQRREDAIRERLDDAKATREEAEERARKLEEERAELDARRGEILDDAREEARQLKEKLEEEARDEVDDLRAAWRAELDEDRDEFLAAMRAEAREGFRRLADDALGALADTTLAERMAEAFGERVGDLGDEDLERLRGALKRGEGVEITLGAEISEQHRERLAEAVRQALGEKIGIGFAEETGDFTGIRLKAGSETLDWTLDAHLDRFAEHLASAFPTEEGEGEGRDGSGEQDGRETGRADAEEGSGDTRNKNRESARAREGAGGDG